MFNYALPDLELLQGSTGDVSTPENEYLLRQLSSLLTQKNNLHGRRIGKAKDAISPGDYVTKRQLNGNLFGTLANRPQPANVAPGTTYFATDRNVTYQSRNNHWYYDSGIQDVTLSPDTKPSPSVLYDTGYMIYATDFDWYFRWNLITWERLNGVNRHISGFRVAPTKVGWGLCDGTTYTCSTDAGSTTTVTTPNLNSAAAFVKYGSSYSASVSAVAPTISGSTGNESTKHTHNTTATGSISGTVTGNLPAHTHDATNTYTGPPKTGGGSAWTGNSAFFTVGGNTGNTDVDHNHLNDFIPIAVSADPPFVTVCEVVPSVDVTPSANAYEGNVYGYTNTVSGGLSHHHAGSSLTVQANEEHYHIVDFPTGGITGTIVPLSLTPSLSFTGNSVASGVDSVDHTHTGGSLTISNDGTPLAVQLIPYIRL